jgi:hypothetical protein
MKLYQMQDSCKAYVADYLGEHEIDGSDDNKLWIHYNKMKRGFIDSYVVDGNDFGPLGMFAYPSFRRWRADEGKTLSEICGGDIDKTIATFIWDTIKEYVMDVLGII